MEDVYRSANTEILEKVNELTKLIDPCHCRVLPSVISLSAFMSDINEVDLEVKFSPCHR
jgi:hypothetical protein